MKLLAVSFVLSAAALMCVESSGTGDFRSVLKPVGDKKGFQQSDKAFAATVKQTAAVTLDQLKKAESEPEKYKELKERFEKEQRELADQAKLQAKFAKIQQSIEPKPTTSTTGTQESDFKKSLLETKSHLKPQQKPASSAASTLSDDQLLKIVEEEEQAAREKAYAAQLEREFQEAEAARLAKESKNIIEQQERSRPATTTSGTSKPPRKIDLLNEKRELENLISVTKSIGVRDEEQRRALKELEDRLEVITLSIQYGV